MIDRIAINLHYSISFLNFKRNYTRLNDYYWISETQRISTRKLYDNVNDDQKIKDYLGVNNKDCNKYPTFVKDYKNNCNDQMNWIRLNTIVGILSCLELYLKSIITIYLLFNPLKIIGLDIAIKNRYNINDRNSNLKKLINIIINKISKGSWGTRLSTICKYIPEFANNNLEKFIKALEFLRVKRNKASHALGLDILEFDSKPSFKNHNLERISHKKLLESFNTIYEFVEWIDKTVISKEFQQFELAIFIFNSFDKKLIKESFIDNNKFIKLKKSIGSYIGQIISSENLRNLLSYYFSNVVAIS